MKKQQGQKTNGSKKNNNQRGNPSLLGRMGQKAAQTMGESIPAGMSEDGFNWLVTAIDPFHDFKRPIAGYPDSDPAATVVQCFKYTIGVAHAGGAYDAHIFTLPVTLPRILQNGVLSGAGGIITQTDMTTPTWFDFLNIITADANTAAMFPTTGAWAPAGVGGSALPGTTDMYDGNSRVIAAGFEIVNTTPEMWRGGRVTVYSMPQATGMTQQKVIDVTGGNLVSGTAVYEKFRAPPATAAEALALQGSMQWNAADGVYMPIPIREVHNPFKQATTNPIEIVAGPSSGATFCLANKATGAAAATSPSYDSNKSACVSTVGCFITGQTAEATFTITLKVYVERAPSMGEASLAVLASPGAAYDIAALQMYSKLLMNLPIATKVGNNSSGDWFRAVMRTIWTVARPLTKLIPGASRYINDKNYRKFDNLARDVGSLIPMLP